MPARGCGGDEEPPELVAHPLDREDRRPRRLGAHRLDGPGSEREPEAGDEPGGPEHPQGILGEGLRRIERGAEHARAKVGEAPCR